MAFRCILALVLLIVVPACAMFRGEPGETVYAASADVIVRATPFATSKGIGRLARDEQVTRTRVERGFAHIVATRRDLEGWVDNGELVSRLPDAGAVEKP